MDAASQMTPSARPVGDLVAPAKEVACAFTAALTLGLYLATFVFTIRWLLFSDEGWKKRKVIHWPMVFVTIFIFLSILTYTALSLGGVMNEVQLLVDKPGVAYVNPMWMSISRCTLANSIALAADLVLIYRCYVVCTNSLAIIALPCLLWVGGVVCTGLQMYLQIAHMHNPNLGPYTWASVNMSDGPGVVLLPFWGSTTVLNIYCTIVLFTRIYSVSKKIGQTAVNKQFRFIARSIAESGVIYMSISFAHFVVWFFFDNFSIQMIGTLNVPLIGIAFNLILIRAAHSRLENFVEKEPGGFTPIEFNANAVFTVDIRPGHKSFESERRSTRS